MLLGDGALGSAYGIRYFRAPVRRQVCGSSYFRQGPGGRVCGSSYFRKLPGGGEAVVFAAAVAVVAVQVAPKRAAQPRPLAS